MDMANPIVDAMVTFTMGSVQLTLMHPSAQSTPIDDPFRLATLAMGLSTLASTQSPAQSKSVGDALATPSTGLAAAMWRSSDLHQEGTLPQGGSNRLAPPSHSSPSDSGWCTCHCPFCLHPRQQPPHHQRSVKLDQRHKRPDTYHRWLQWTQLHVG